MPIVINYLFLDSTDSTQKWAKRQLSQLDLSLITCIYAAYQTDGIGAHGHKWHSPRCENIYATFVFSIPAPLHHLHNLAQILSLSVSFALENLSIFPSLKWPNDLMLSGKKLAGVLCEMNTHNHKAVCMAGLGLNVNMPLSDLALIDQEATSLLIETARSWDYQSLLRQIGDRFLLDLVQYQEEGFAPFYDAYCQRMPYIGASIQIGSELGIIESIHLDGRLVVTLPSGKRILTASGSIQNR